MIAEISIFVFWTSFFSALSAKNFWMMQRDPMEQRIQRLFGTGVPAAPSLAMPAHRTKAGKQFRDKLLLAGLYGKTDLDRTIRFQRFCMVSPFLVMSLLFLLRFPPAHILILGGLSGVIFILVPRLWLIRLMRRRRREIERHIPNTLDLLILCLEAGLSFDSSLVRVAVEQERISRHISRELQLTNQEVLAGKTREEALKNFSWRAGTEDVKNIVGAILQSIKLGTSLVKALRTQAAVIRKKRRERIRALILKTPVKLIFPLLFFIFPTLLVVILGPSLINIFRHLSILRY